MEIFRVVFRGRLPVIKSVIIDYEEKWKTIYMEKSSLTRNDLIYID